MDPLQAVQRDCFIFESNDIILGLAILCAERQVNFVTNHYHIEDYVSVQSIPQNNYGRLLHFVLMPIFSAYHRFFFRELARLSDLTVIFYRLHHKDETGNSLVSKNIEFSSHPTKLYIIYINSHRIMQPLKIQLNQGIDFYRLCTWIYPLVSCLNDMIPVDPRRQAEYEFPIVQENFNSSENNTKCEGNDVANDEFSLFMTSPRLAMMPRTIIDTRIVVVGASDCGIAFAEYLSLRLTQRYRQLTNLTLISPNGIPFDNESSSDCCEYLLPFRGRFHSGYRRYVVARTWLNIIYGTMAAIDRVEKYVTVMNQGNIAYDYLILTCGLQYQNSTLWEEIKMEKQEKNEVQDQMPWNCLTVNNDKEASTCFGKIRKLTRDFKERKAILFYGCNIDCYCTLGGLIKLGVEPSWITLIESSSFKSYNTRDQAFFHDYEVNKVVADAILRSGVQVFSEWTVIDWTLTENEQSSDAKLIMIKSITIEKEEKKKKLYLSNLKYKNRLLIPVIIYTVSAFCRAGLVFDGSLIIDSECRTNDPFIFAAGTMTKYSRKFYADVWQHKYYNSMEVGERLGQILWKVIEWDVQVSEQVSKKKEVMHLTPSIFRAPIVTACILPGDYHYLHVCKPGKATWDNTTKINHNNYGNTFITGSCKSEIGYFRIRLNMYDTVESVTCVSRKKLIRQTILNDCSRKILCVTRFFQTFRVQDMIVLYGKHESMLNELKFRFRRCHTYFRVYHLIRARDIYDNSLDDDCINTLIESKWKTISEKDQNYIESKYAGSIYHQELENNLMNFLEFYENELPMYCTLRKQRQMYMDIEESPLYFDQ
ncbi:CFA61 protein, partial [Acromyrmex insinuator]